ncbi:hypothetical protein [Paenibacillus terrae]|uniref:hypothetical protein n=1 Tax=Paenibacillus terrae TaxID=159743 RepID=UPI0016568ACD|nr:hypothetical protein [Paenibacillus terrae]
MLIVSPLKTEGDVLDASTKILEAAFDLAEKRPVDQFSYADLAEASGVHWTRFVVIWAASRK